MGWETRGGQGRYYTRSRREGGRVVREYLGGGELAEAVAALDGLERERRDLERQQAQDRWREEADLAAAVAGFCAEVEAVLRETLEAAGYHRHDRGQWRRRHGTDKHGESEAGADAGGTGDAGAA